MMEKMTLDDKLGLDSFCTDEGRSHIEIQKNFADKAELHRLVLACPAGCTSWMKRGICVSVLKDAWNVAPVALSEEADR